MFLIIFLFLPCIINKVCFIILSAIQDNSVVDLYEYSNMLKMLNTLYILYFPAQPSIFPSKR